MRRYFVRWRRCEPRRFKVSKASKAEMVQAADLLLDIWLGEPVSKYPQCVRSLTLLLRCCVRTRSANDRLYGTSTCHGMD